MSVHIQGVCAEVDVRDAVRFFVAINSEIRNVFVACGDLESALALVEEAIFPGGCGPLTFVVLFVKDIVCFSFYAEHWFEVDVEVNGIYLDGFNRDWF